MTTASRSLATAPLTGALRERLAPPSYTTNGDMTEWHVGSNSILTFTVGAKASSFPIQEIVEFENSMKFAN
jgi:hypothetical protein